jgi:hypothetical protein
MPLEPLRRTSAQSLCCLGDVVCAKSNDSINAEWLLGSTTCGFYAGIATAPEESLFIIGIEHSSATA